GAADQERLALGGDDGLDAVEHVAERDERRRRDVPVVPRELLPHVDDPVALLREAQRIGHRHFADRGLRWGLIGRDLISHGLPCWADGDPQSAGSRRWWFARSALDGADARR